MQTLASVILASLILFGLIFVLEQEEPPYMMSGKELGTGYWGQQCEVEESGYLICKTTGGLMAQTCVAMGQQFRLKLNPRNFREQPIVLEVSSLGSEPTSATEILIGEAYGEGTGVCYTEGYKFPGKNILIDRGSNCGPASTEPENLMFYLGTDSEKSIPCTVTLSTDTYHSTSETQIIPSSGK